MKAIPRASARTEQKTALKPITVGPRPESIELMEKDLPELPMYNPPPNLQIQPSEWLATGLSELDTFQRLLRLRLSIESLIEQIATSKLLEKTKSLFLTQYYGYQSIQQIFGDSLAVYFIGYQKYRESLIDALLNTPPPSPPPSLPSIPLHNRAHYWERFEKWG
jgi:hypothetical protein